MSERTWRSSVSPNGEHPDAAPELTTSATTGFRVVRIGRPISADDVRDLDDDD